MARTHKRTVKKKKKQSIDWDNHDDVVTHLEPNIMECEVNWALQILLKANGGNGIPRELFKHLKEVSVKVLDSIRQQIWKIQQ